MMLFAAKKLNMNTTTRSNKLLSLLAGCALTLGVLSVFPSTTAAETLSGYRVDNFVTDGSESDLINPRGLEISDRIWTANENSGTVTGFGTTRLHLTVPETASTNPAPTGLIANPSLTSTNPAFFLTNIVYTTNFVRVNTTNGVVTNTVIRSNIFRAPARLIVVTESGTIAAWNSVVNRNFINLVDSSGSTAVYKGVAIARNSSGQWRLYVANFHSGLIEVYDENFHFVNNINDPTAPTFYAPFNIKRLFGKLFVTYARQGLDAVTEEAGAGNGYISIFNEDGVAVRQFVQTGGALNAPWGLAQAPSHFGKFSHAVLVANHGDGVINAYSVITGEHLGQLSDQNGDTLVIDGLWGLHFNLESETQNKFDFESSRLYFTAGPNAGQNGTLGTVRANAPFSNR
ncbi:MAG: hypothetical protein JWM68_3224 [Verrucomicrobiales bacterium]|nr:hypothetical protein [Verrucomicrobiales bacterium]